MNFWERNTYDGQNGQNGYSNPSGQNSSNAQGGGSAPQDFNEQFAKYSNKSEDQLMSELTSMVSRMKGEGTFDPAAIENLYNTAAPFLNEAQRQRMRAIVDMLKG